MRNIKKIILTLLLVIPVTSYAFSGGSGTKEDPYQIRTCPELQNIITLLAEHFILIDNVNCNLWDYGDGGGFMPLGNLTTPFTGKLDGNNFKVSYIKINRYLQDNIGIFGVTLNAEITNVNLDNIYILGKSNVGGLVGFAKSGTKISNVYASLSEINADYSHVGGLVGRSEGTSNVRNTIQNSSVDLIVKAAPEGSTSVGGMVGSASYADISNSHALGTVSGNARVGGLAGSLGSSITLLNTYATALVHGWYDIGGLVGSVSTFPPSHITNSYATGKVVIEDGNAGGLIGSAYNLLIDSCYATGEVESLTTSQTFNTGGLVGDFTAGGMLKNSYATGTVTNNHGVLGGLVGRLSDSTVSHSYSVGRVSGTNSWAIGGLIGAFRDDASVVGSYWNTITSGQLGSAGGTPKTTIEMYQQATYVDWDFANTWKINQGFDYPHLQWEQK